jgi:hypothetical protein
VSCVSCVWVCGGGAATDSCSCNAWSFSALVVSALSSNGKKLLCTGPVCLVVSIVQSIYDLRIYNIGSDYHFILLIVVSHRYVHSYVAGLPNP